jgi:hypothetical protein
METPSVAKDLEVAFFQVQHRCLTVVRWLFALAIPLTIINITFSCIYGYIFATQVRVWPRDALSSTAMEAHAMTVRCI